MIAGLDDISSEVGGASLAELLTLLGSFVGMAFALVRYSLSQQQRMTDRFVTFLERALMRQEEANERFSDAIAGLAENVRENSQLVGRLSERVNGRS